MGKPIKNNNALLEFLTSNNNTSRGSNSAENTSPPPATLSIDVLVPYAKHPFSLYEGERLDDMVESIKEKGIYLPIIVRPHKEVGKYEILSGHNRVNAAKLAGLTEVPIIIRTDLNEDEACLLVTGTNLYQRSITDFKHSERAYALKSHLEALKNVGGGQGRRNDLLKEIERLSNPDYNWTEETSYHSGTKLNSYDKTGEKYGLSKMTVARYVRLASLFQPILARIDDGEVGLLTGVELSYLTEDEQKALNSLLDEGLKINQRQAEQLRELSRRDKLTEDDMRDVLIGERKVKTSKPKALKVQPKVYSRFFKDDTPQKEMLSTIEKALEFYFQSRKADSQGIKP